MNAYLRSHFNTFIGFPQFCVINIIQFHFRWNIIRFYLRRKEIKKTLNPNRIFDIIFWSAFLTSLYFKHSFANNPFLEQFNSHANSTFFSMSSPVVEWCCAYSTLPFDGSRDDRITLVADFFRMFLWIVTRYVYSLNIFFQFCICSFSYCNFLSQKLTTDLI